jgi:hypothetical protein
LVLLRLFATVNYLNSPLVCWNEGWDTSAVRAHIINVVHLDKQLINDYLKPVASQLLQVDEDELLEPVAIFDGILNYFLTKWNVFNGSMKKGARDNLKHDAARYEEDRGGGSTICWMSWRTLIFICIWRAMGGVHIEGRR